MSGNLVFCGNPTGSRDGGESVTLKRVLQRGVMICIECLSKPDKLDPVKIIANLKRYGWEPDDLELVKMTIQRFVYT